MHENPPPNNLQAVRATLLRKMGTDGKAYPTVIEQKFPHLLGLFADQWGTPALDRSLRDLMLCDREQRQGFPPEVASEIFTLLSVHGRLGLSPKESWQDWVGIEEQRLDAKGRNQAP